jgi:hypothetical protein
MISKSAPRFCKWCNHSLADHNSDWRIAKSACKFLGCTCSAFVSENEYPFLWS